MASSQPPLCVLLDMDGTMIGNILPAACEYEVVRSIEPRRLPVFRKQLVARLKYGTIRPHLAAFCRAAAAQGVRLYVYTASEDGWARFLIPCIEQSLGVKFQRPLFTRTSCVQLPGGELKKSIEKVVGPLHTQLRKAGSSIDRSELARRCVLIDNTPGVLLQPSQHLRCPTYRYLYVYDVLASLSIETLHARFDRAGVILQKHGMLPFAADTSGQTFHEFMQAYHAHLAFLLQRCYAQNLHALRHDAFWAGAAPRLGLPKPLE